MALLQDFMLGLFLQCVLERLADFAGAVNFTNTARTNRCAHLAIIQELWQFADGELGHLLETV